MLGRNGSIVNSSSLAGIGGGAAGVVYTMSKYAVIGLTLNTAWQYAKKGVRCNAMAIGAVQTNIMENTALGMDPEGGARAGEWAGLIPAFLQPMDVANVACFLASGEASMVNGAVVNVDGGWHSV
jgi:NAD(P)-dependent dehydrogenase (short-subunit alcohol dehydrogenase family)